MVDPKVLSRDAVCFTILSWGTGVLTDEEMYLWATNNYFPAHQQVAPGEPDHVALAIGITLTEFECARPPYKFGREVAASAVAFINAEPNEFETQKIAFLQSL
jgi:hypothetical protein